MKKLLLSLGACSLAFVAPVTIPTPAQAYTNTGIVNICKELVELGVYESVGQCARFAAEICNVLKKEGLFPLEVEPGVILRNHGDCVNYVKELNDA